MVTDFERDGSEDAPLDPTLVPRRAPVEDFVADGECLLYSAVRDEAATLNRTATEIWELCDGTRSIRSIARTLGERYSVDEMLLLDDVAAAIAVLRSRGLVNISQQRREDIA
jgi:hypothetical protein